MEPHPKRSNGDELSFSRDDGIRFEHPMEGSLALLEVSDDLQIDRRRFIVSVMVTTPILKSPKRREALV